MTAVAGIAQGGRVWIGADSAGTGGYAQTIRADGKVFRNGPFVMGFTSSFRMGQLLRHSFSPPRRHPDDPLEKYMVGPFIDAVRDCFKDGGFAEEDRKAEVGGTFLVGVSGRLFRIESDYQVGEAVSGFDAVGSGHDLARGSLFTSDGKPKARILTALEAAAAMNAGVRGPFIIVRTREAL
jgi:hypothetical protein